MSPDHLSNPSDHRFHIRPLAQPTSAGRFLSQRHNTRNRPCINWYLLRIACRRRLPLSKLRGLNRSELYRGTHPEPSSTVTILWAPYSSCSGTQVLYLVSRERSTLEGVQDLEATVYFSSVIDRPSVSVSIVTGLCDVWNKIKSTSFIPVLLTMKLELPSPLPSDS